jgi:cell division protein FtsL
MNNGKTAGKQSKVLYLPWADRQQRGAGGRLKVILTALAMLYFTALFASQAWRLLSLQRSLGAVEQEISVVRSQNDLLLQEIEQLYSPAYLEKLARQELGMVRPDEILFFFRDNDRSPADGR